jgi:hypothetical protein
MLASSARCLSVSSVKVEVSSSHRRVLSPFLRFKNDEEEEEEEEEC